MEPGYLADLVLIDRDHVRGVWSDPRVDAAELLLRRACRKHVRDVMVNGEWVVRDGEHTRLDAGEVIETLRRQLMEAGDPRTKELSCLAQTVAPYIKEYYEGWDISER